MSKKLSKINQKLKWLKNMMNKIRCFSFSPIVDKKSKVLILGSFPSIISVKNDFYYGNKRNHFWAIINTIFQSNATSVIQKKCLILKNNIALWDSVKICERKNSSDSQLKVIEANDIAGLLEDYNSIHTIVCNGQKSYQVYKKYNKNIPLPTIVLPSTSPANTSMTMEQKLLIYQEAIQSCLQEEPQ